MSIPCRLEKIGALTDKGLRTQTVEGTCLETPIPGQGFGMIGASLTEGANMRAVLTSPIKRVEWVAPNTCHFYTENSTYKFTRLDTTLSTP